MSAAEALARLVAGEDVDDRMLEAVVDELLAPETPPALVAAVLVAWRLRGEGEREILAVARGLRARMRRVPDVPPDAVDTCGTGGDGARTFNVSTAAALVTAGAGVPVAKHGNRAMSGAVGGADVLETLGVRLELEPARIAACVREVGIAFLYAPSLHPAMRAVAATRRALGIRTVFNLVGPLANPAGVQRQVLGVAGERWLMPMAAALAGLGAERAWVVHGQEGVDELTLGAPSTVVEVKRGALHGRFEIDPQALGLTAAPLAALRVGSARESAARIRAILAGEQGPDRDVVCLNAAAALVVAGAVADPAEGLEGARASIDSGAAARVLAGLVAFTTGGHGA